MITVSTAGVWNAYRKAIITALLVCVPLTAASVLSEMFLSGFSREHWNAPTRFSFLAAQNLFTLFQKVIPFLLGLILGYFTVRDIVAGLKAAVIAAAILIGLSSEWIIVGMLADSPYAAKVIDRGIVSIFRLASLSFPFALVGIIVGSGIRGIGSKPESAEAPKQDSVYPHILLERPYICGGLLAIALVICGIAIRNVFTMLLFHVAAVVFGAIIGRAEVQGWSDVFIELLKILAITAIGTFAYIVIVITVSRAGGDAGLAFFMIPLLLGYMTPWAAAGLIAGWRMWR